MSTPKIERFVALFDLHYGYERKNGHKVPLHDSAALATTLDFIQDFKPHHVVLGGDILDCGAISHHNHGRPGAVEGMRLVTDATELSQEVIKPLEDLVPGKLVYHIGNHEDWLQDLSDTVPALEGMLDIRTILKLSKRWEVIEQGAHSKLGKLIFVHGDQIRGNANPGKTAVEAYEKNIRLGHFHTYQTFTKTSAVEDNGHTGTVVPCLCKKNPRYNEGAPNKWMQGFLYGYINQTDGSFSDYVAVIVKGKTIINGKVYSN